MVFSRVFLVFMMIAAGFGARKAGLLDGETTTRLSRLVVVLFYPALIFATLTSQFTFSRLVRRWPLPAGAAMTMLAGFAIGAAVVHLLRFGDERQKRTFHFQCTINNYSFLPLPIVLMYWGERGAGELIFSTVGSELSVWTLGMFALTGLGGVRWSSIRRLFTPPMLAILAAICTLWVAEFACPDFADSAGFRDFTSAALAALDMFGKATIPLAMVVAGSRMTELRIGQLVGGAAAAAVALRLLVVPACVVLLLRLLPFPDDARKVLYVVAVMPCAIASVLLSDVYGGDSDFAASTVLTTHLVGLVTIPLWLDRLL